MNRISYVGDTAHPYANSTGTGCPSTSVIADYTERPPASGMTVDLRTRFHMIDMESSGSTFYDYAQLIDGDTGTCLLNSIGGQHAGATVTSWVTPSAGHIKVGF